MSDLRIERLISTFSHDPPLSRIYITNKFLGGGNDMRDQHYDGGLQFTAILKGLVSCFAFLIILSLILGFFFSRNDSMAEDVMNRALMIINYTAIFSGGIMGARWSQTKGWLHGGLVGLIYMVIIVFIGSRYVSFAVGLEVMLRVISGFLTGALGGVLGVNLK
jgi:putative membrane protein (TIGR04086 family)